VIVAVETDGNLQLEKPAVDLASRLSSHTDCVVVDTSRVFQQHCSENDQKLVLYCIMSYNFVIFYRSVFHLSDCECLRHWLTVGNGRPASRTLHHLHRPVIMYTPSQPSPSSDTWRDGVKDGVKCFSLCWEDAQSGTVNVWWTTGWPRFASQQWQDGC